MEQKITDMKAIIINEKNKESLAVSSIEVKLAGKI
jgi:hypothetical protein